MTAPVVLVADPPWQMQDKLPHGGSAKHYKLISQADLECIDLPDEVEQASNAVLFLWRLSSCPDEALRVVRAWRFRPKSELVWLKQTRYGKTHFGMGRYVRMAHETCIIATRGKAFPDAHNVRSVFTAAVREHSRKPEEFYSIVQELYPRSTYYELFARTVREGWVQTGDQLGVLS